MKRLMVVLALLAVSFPLRADAQSGDAGLRGYVTDEQGGLLPGVTVTAAGPAIMTPASAVTDAAGYYRLVNLPPGTYAISAELTGFSTQRREEVVLRAGNTFQVDIVMRIGSLAETITVSGESPMLEVSKPSNILNFEGEFQKQVPIQARRNWSDFLEVTPGVIARPFDDNSGRMVYYGHATEHFAHVIQLEGMNAANYNDGQVAYVNMGTDVIQDVQVKSGGIDASEPMGTGLVMNVVTRSGGNQLSGSAGYALQPIKWNGDNPPSSEVNNASTPTIQGVNQLDLAVGGPIRRDRIWFFAAYRYADLETGISRDAAQLALQESYVPGFEPFNNTSTTNQPYAKVTARFNAAHQMSAYWQYDRVTLTSDQPLHYEPIRIFVTGGNLFGAKLSSLWGNRMTTQITVGYNDKSGADDDTFADLPGSGPQIDIHQSAFASAGRLVGSGALLRGGNLESLSLEPSSVFVIRGDLTYFKEGWVGSHEFQTGLYAAPRLRTGRITRYVNDGFSLEEQVMLDPNDVGVGTRPFHRRYRTPTSVAAIDAEDRDIGLYVQDSWKPTSRLTASLGLRVDFVKRHDAIFDIDRMNDVAVGPRLGFSYLLTKDARNVLRGSVVRAHEGVNGRDAATNQAAGGGGAETLDTYDFDGDGVFETQFVTPAVAAALAGYEFSPDLHQPWVDEYIVGFRKQFDGQMSVDVAFNHRRYTDRYGQVDVNGIYPDAPGQPFIGFGRVDPRRGVLRQLTNNYWDKLVYSSLEITATKNVARLLQFVGGFHRQWQHQAGTWNPTDPARFIQPDAYPNDKLIYMARGVDDTDSYRLFAFGPSWQEYTIRAGGTWFAPLGFVISASYTQQAGPWPGHILTRLAANDPDVTRFGPATIPVVGGSQSNPLATTIRIKYPTRGEGQEQYQADPVRVLNLKVGKKLRFDDRREVELSANVFNLANANGHWQYDYANASQEFNPGFLRMLSRQAARALQLTFVFRY
jgi:Carboxypeptidase regulatory-like domain/TonB dependent receptor